MPHPAEEKEAVDQLFAAIYKELRELARGFLRNSRDPVINPTALVNEAYFKLIASSGLASKSNLHFKRIAARAMKQVLVDTARQHMAIKRGGKDAIFVTLDDQLNGTSTSVENILIIEQCLDKLRTMNARQAAVVEYRFFGGLSTAETAALLEVAEVTVERDWRTSKAWLASELQQHQKAR